MVIFVHSPAINQDNARALGPLLTSVSFNTEISAVTTIRDPDSSTILNAALLLRSETAVKYVQSNSRNCCRMGDVRNCVIVTGTYNPPTLPPEPIILASFSFLTHITVPQHATYCHY